MFTVPKKGEIVNRERVRRKEFVYHEATSKRGSEEKRHLGLDWLGGMAWQCMAGVVALPYARLGISMP